MAPTPKAFINTQAQRLLEPVMRADTLPGLVYDAPEGDPGLFGPDSAIWYVHAHPSVLLGGVATLLMQALEPGMGTAGTYDSKAFEDPWGRFGRSGSFVLGMTFGPTPVTERLTRMVRAMHARVAGEMPDGRPYSANDPHSQRVAAALFPLGVGAAHLRYHPRPLRGADLDRFVADWAVISESVGAQDAPKTWAEAKRYAASIAPTLEIPVWNRPSAWSHLEKELTAHWFGAPGGRLLLWGLNDLMQPWARRLYDLPDLSRAQTVAARTALFSGINALHLLTGELPELRQARQRLAGHTTAAHAA